MIVNDVNGTIQPVGDIESGIVFKYAGDFYITTTNYDYDMNSRTCVNVILGSLNDISLGICVEAFYNSYIKIKGVTK